MSNLPPRRDLQGELLHQPLQHEDAALFEELERADFDGPLWGAFKDDLVVYGWDALHGLVYRGAIAEVQTGTPHPTLPPSHLALFRGSRDLRDELIVDGLLWAIPKFREHLREGRWSPTGGASLKSYFIGTAAAGFWVFYKRWVDEEERARKRDQRLLDELLVRPLSVNPSDVADFRALIGEILKACKPRERSVVLGILQGRSYAEIATALNTSTRAVEALMYRLRGRLRPLVKEYRS